MIQDIQPAKLLYRRLFAELTDSTQTQRKQNILCLQALWLKWYILLAQTQFVDDRLFNLWLVSLADQLAYLFITCKLDQWVQRQLLMLNQDEALPQEDRLHAELSLRCYISDQIRAVCVSLGTQFGTRHGFAWYDLLPFVMDDTDPTRSICQPAPIDTIRNRDAPSAKTYDYLAAKILRTFEPDRSSLATWTNTLTRQHQPLKAFLLEHGVYLISDWALLNDTEPETLRRILTQTYGLPISQVEQAGLVLSCYHTVYRNQYRRSRTRSGCQPPTVEQLQQMLEQTNLSLSPKALMQVLLDLADYLRQYRICRRGGPLPADSIDALEAGEPLPSQLTSDSTQDDDDDQTTFLNRYRQQLVSCLDQAIAAEIQQRYESLQRRASTVSKSRVFLEVLKRYYCERAPMTTIATEMGLKGQFEVTRLLKIKEFRSSVRQRTLNQLRNCVLELAKEHAHPDCLQKLDQQVDIALNEYLDQVILEPSVRSNADRVHPDQNLFVQRLCCVIQQS